MLWPVALLRASSRAALFGSAAWLDILVFGGKDQCIPISAVGEAVRAKGQLKDRY